MSRNGQPVFCPRLLSIEGAAAYLGISPTTFRQIAPKLTILRCGRRVLYDRAVLDALQGIVYANDSRAVGHSVWKEYGPEAGLELVISELIRKDGE